MLRLRSRSAAKTVAPLRITTITSGVSMSAYSLEIWRPSLCTRRAIWAAEIIGLGLLALSRLSPSLSVGACWVRTSVMQLKSYWRSNTDWMPDGFHFHESSDEVRTLLVFDLDHSLHVACRSFLDRFDFVGCAAGRVDRID